MPFIIIEWKHLKIACCTPQLIAWPVNFISCYKDTMILSLTSSLQYASLQWIFLIPFNCCTREASTELGTSKINSIAFSQFSHWLIGIFFFFVIIRRMGLCTRKSNLCYLFTIFAHALSDGYLLSSERPYTLAHYLWKYLQSLHQVHLFYFDFLC